MFHSVKDPRKILIEMHASDLRLGAVATTLDLAIQLGKRGFQFAFCGDLRPDFVEICCANNFQTFSHSSRQFARSQILQYACDVAYWLLFLSRFRPNIIIQNFSGWGQSLTFAGKLCHIPVLSRAGDTYDSRNPSNKWIAGYLAYNRFHARFILDSPLASRVFITGHPFRPVKINGDNPLNPKASPETKVLKFLFLGQLAKRKGLTTLVEAFSRMEQSAVLQLVGGDWRSPGYPQEIRRLISSLGIEDRVELHNHQADVVNWLKQSDVFVFPSVDDTHPRVIMEAMFLGVPVVAANSGGIPEIIDDGVTGILVEANCRKALTNALDLLAKSRNLRTQIGINARSSMQSKLESSKVLDRYQEIFDSFIQKPSEKNHEPPRH